MKFNILVVIKRNSSLILLSLIGLLVLLISPAKVSAQEVVDLCFSTPPCQTAPTYNIAPTSSINLWADAKSNQVVYLGFDLIFDVTRVQLTEATTNPIFSQIIAKTPIATANQEGRMQIALGLSETANESIPTGQFEIGSFSFTTASTLYAQSWSSVSLDSVVVQVVDVNQVDLPFTTQIANLNVSIIDEGTGLPPTTTPAAGEQPLSIKYLEIIFGNVLSAVLALAGIVLFIMLVFGGFKYLTSVDQKKKNPKNKTEKINFL